MSRQSLSRIDRVAQMTKQEELIAKKRLEILEKQKTLELGKAVAAAQTSNQNSSNQKETTTSEPIAVPIVKPSLSVSIVPPEIQAKFQNSFCNDGSFLTHFKNILEQTKKKEEVVVAQAEEVLQGTESTTNDETVLETQISQSLELAQIDLSQPPPQISIPLQPKGGESPDCTSPCKTDNLTETVVKPTSLPADSEESAAVPPSSDDTPLLQCSPGGSSTPPSNSTATVASLSPTIAAESVATIVKPSQLTGSLSFLNGPPPLASGPPTATSQSSPNTSGPPTGMSPPPSMSDQAPSTGISGRPPTMPAQSPNMSGPPPSMSAPPPSMSGPPPSMSGPTLGKSGQPLGMSGPPPSMSGPPPSMSGPPPNMSGPPPSMTGPPPQSMAGFPPQSMAGPQSQNMAGPPPRSMAGLPPQSMAGPPPQSMTGPPPQSMASLPPQSMAGPPPKNMTGPSLQNMSGPPPNMSGPPPNMSGPPPLVSGPPVNSGSNISMSGPPLHISRNHGQSSSMPGPPPLTSMPPPSMSGPPPSVGGQRSGYSNMSSFNTSQSQGFFNPCIASISNIPSFSTITTPPPPPPPSTPLYLIPPPDPLQLNKIPPPKELDLNAIPKPEMNVETIRVPNEYQLQQQQQHQLQHTSLHLQGHRDLQQDANEQFLPTTLESLVELVAENGDACEDRIRSRKNDVHSSLWFIFDKESLAYKNYRNMVESYRCNRHGGPRQIVNLNISDDSNSRKLASNDEKYDPESVIESHDDSDDEYMRDIMDKNLSNLKRKIEESRADSDGSGDEMRREKNRKRKSRWGGKASSGESTITAMTQSSFANQNKPLLSAVQRTDPALLQYARQNYGTTNLTEEDWRKCEDHFKINLLYQDMMKKRNEIDQLATNGKFKYEYDSDEDVTGGTWEHKLRTAEMEATQAWADALTAQSEGKHHIGDFLPPEELKKFMEKYDAKKSNRTPDLSDYKEYKLTEDNIGFQMLQKLGWKEGQGLGADGSGIVDPVNKAAQRDANQGLGAGAPSNPDECDNEYEAYRKRMMLAYRFRPNPLNNPRRAYY